MATLSLSTLPSSLHSIAAQKPNLSASITTTNPRWSVQLRHDGASRRWKPNYRGRLLRKLRSAEEETLGPVLEDGPEASPEAPAVSVPVSPSDTLTMFFQADGTLSEAAIPRVTQSFEEMDGVSNLKVQVIEGIASVELEKLTTVQATGVASSLVENLQGSGFKLQTLHLSFKEQENVV